MIRLPLHKKMKFSEDFFSKYKQVYSFLRTCLLKKYLMENFIFCAVTQQLVILTLPLSAISLKWSNTLKQFIEIYNHLFEIYSVFHCWTYLFMMYMGYFSLTPALLALIACLIFSRFFLLARKRRLRDDINNSIFMFQDFRLIIGKVGGGGGVGVRG